jgi:hypothetical protein
MEALQILPFNQLAGGSLMYVLRSSSATSSPTPGWFLQILLCLSPSNPALPLQSADISLEIPHR